MTKCDSCLQSQQIEFRDCPTSSSEGGDSLAGTVERKIQYIWVPFLDQEDIKSLSMGVIWNFGKGTGLSWADIKLWGTRARL